MVFHRSLSLSKSQQYDRIILSFLADLNNAMVSWLPLVLLFPNLPYFLPIFGDLPSAPTTISITFTFKDFCEGNVHY